MNGEAERGVFTCYTETNRGQSSTSRNPRARSNKESRDRCKRGTREKEVAGEKDCKDGKYHSEERS